jgi:hypothetical protein
METLMQAPETSQSALERIIEQLKTASQETLEQVRHFFQLDSDATTEVSVVTVATTTVAGEAPENDTVLESEPDQPETETENGLELAATTEETENVETFDLPQPIEEPTTEELQNEISSDEIEQQETENAAIDVLIGETPKADFEIRLDEIYSIRVVANEVVNSIEDLQNEVAILRAQVNGMFTQEQLEDKVKELVATALRERFV